MTRDKPGWARRNRASLRAQKHADAVPSPILTPRRRADVTPGTGISWPWRAPRGMPTGPDQSDRQRVNLNPEARRQLGLYVARGVIFGTGSFADPSWLILLDLMGRADGTPLAKIGDSCAASGAPRATALRCIFRLVEEGYIDRLPDPADQRSSLLRLTPVARDRLSAWLLVASNARAHAD